MDRIPNFHQSYFALGSCQFTPVRLPCLTRTIIFDKIGLMAIPHSDDNVFNGGHIEVHYQWTENDNPARIVKDKEFHNCSIHGVDGLVFQNCKFRNCFITAEVKGILVTSCDFASSTIIAGSITEDERPGKDSKFDKCCFRLHKTAWYPDHLKSYQYHFADYLKLLRRFGNEHLPPIMATDRWYDTLSPSYSSAMTKIDLNEPIIDWKGPIEILWGDHADDFRKTIVKISPQEAAILLAVDKFLSNNIVSPSTFKKIIYDWGSNHR